MISDARGGHVSPGVYTEERDVAISVQSLGITSLGIAGETLKGPAFQPIPIKSWADFVNYFGGTSSEKFKETGLLKYELPYIAKSYLDESRDLTVCRVLGLSGYDAGKAFVIGAQVGSGTGTTTMPVAVLRSKAKYGEGGTEPCEKGNSEQLNFLVSNLSIAAYSGATYGSNCTVINGTPFVSAIEGYVIDGVPCIMSEAQPSTAWTTGVTAYELVDGLMTACSGAPGEDFYTIEGEINRFAIIYSGATICDKTLNVSLNPSHKDYLYNVLSIDPTVGSKEIYIESVFDGSMASLLGSGKYNGQAFKLIAVDTTNHKELESFKEPFRPSMTPWIVSEAIAGSESIDLKKLFRFITISDGNASNYQVKVSIQNIRIDAGLFDVVVRDFYDDDAAPSVLEKFSNCSLRKNDGNFIGLKIGTYDGEYEIRSKYITVMLNDESEISDSVPAGFLGYPVPNYGCDIKPVMTYNRFLSPDVRVRKQYFGLNRDVLDTDIINYKGVNAYSEDSSDNNPELLTNGFHLDSILSEEVLSTEDISATTENPLLNAVVLVDGQSGFTFTAVSPFQSYKGTTISDKIPRIVSEDYCKDTIYEDVAARKFTVYTYGGFDGWDVFRGKRTNTDMYKATKYNAKVPGNPFETSTSLVGNLNATLNLRLPSDAIPSDYYAYLAGYKQFVNPEETDINLFATPGIDFANNSLLVSDAIEIIEDPDYGRGGDALYIISAPQFASDGVALTTEEVVDALEDSGIESSYACTFFPWIKVFDSEDKVFVYLPATKDVVRDMAATDNHKYPWFSPAGMERGEVKCERTVFKTTLQDEDALYAATINPIKTFAKDGVKLWGNKTMYMKETPLNRINVRRLMLRVKKLVVRASRNLIFEQYDTTLEKQFKSLVDPILSDVKQNRGLYDYKILTESTPETRDQHILPAKIMVKPTPALEYISISFVVYPESVEFSSEL